MRASKPSTYPEQEPRHGQRRETSPAQRTTPLGRPIPPPREPRRPHEDVQDRGGGEGLPIQVEADAARGLHVDPRRQKITVADWCDQWLAGKTNLAATTRERYEGIVQGHIRDQWARTQLGGLKHAKVQAWLAGLELAPASVRKIHRVFSRPWTSR